MSEKISKKIKKFLKILGLFSILGFFLYKKKDEIFNAIDSEKDHMVEVLNKEKQECQSFYYKTKRRLKDYFIPSEENDHKPHSLHPKKLLSYVLILVLIKVAVTGFLFFYYPSQAELATIVTSRIIELANKDRIENGVEPLKVDLTLTKFAQTKAQDMIEKSYFSHDSPDGRKPWQWINKSEYDYVYAGENLAMDFTSAELIHQAFMKSPTHRKNILNERYKDIAVAVVSGEMDGRHTDILVQFFGTRRSELSSLAKATLPGIEEATLVEKTESVKTETLPSEEVIEVIGAEQEANLENNEEQKVAGEEVIDNQYRDFQASQGSGIIVLSQADSQKSLVDTVIEYSNILFIAFLIFISIALFLNIVVKVRVQHPQVILQSLAVIALVMALILVKFHFVEQVGQQLIIL